MSKDFLTHNQQMKYLRDKKKIDCHGTKDKILLCRTGYFNLVNGYKKPFTCGKKGDDHVYFGNTKLVELSHLKHFDENLRLHLLKYITRVEEDVRTIVGYKFDEVNENGKIQWYEIAAYDSDFDAQSIMKTISSSFQQVHQSRQLYIKHYIETHKQIPTWILVKTINFSTFIDFLEYCKPEVKASICNLYGLKNLASKDDYSLMKSSLHWLRQVRNSCAHNERIFDIYRDSGRILDKYMISMPNSYRRERRQMIFDLIVYLKYFLPHREYLEFINDIRIMLSELNNSVPSQVFDKVRADMGIKDISHLALLENEIKDIKYNKI